jgi:uncharacterized Zn-binding protein involved in type VI secretion
MAGLPAARITDTMADGGLITGPGDATVLIGKLPAAVAGDMATWPAGQSTASFPIGSTTVLIGGKPAIRVGDTSTGGTVPIIGETTVLIG